MLAPLLGGLSLWAAPAAAAQAPAGHEARVVIAVLPFGTTVSEIAAVPGLAPGLVSAGLGSVPRAQTWLDTSQGNRVNETLYDGPLPPLEFTGGRVPPAAWQRVLERAESAPAQIVPGLLGSTLEDAGIPVAVDERGGLASLIGVDRDGAARAVDANDCSSGCGPGLTVTRLGPGQLAALAGRLGPDDMLIAVADGTDSEQQLLPAGVAGLGEGDLTSDSTRTDGLVISTDIAPTVLDRLGVAVPSEVKGSAIEVAGERDPEGVAELESRLGHRPSRDTVVLLPLGIWLLATGLAALACGAERGPDRASPAGARVRLDPAAVAPAGGAGRGPDDVGVRRRDLRAPARAGRGSGHGALRSAGARLRAQRGRVRGRCGRGVAADRVLGARAQPGCRGALLRHRQRTRGDPDDADAGRDRRVAREPGPDRARAPPRAGSSASRSPPPPRSRPAASVPTSARRSCSGWAPRPRPCWRCDWSVAGRSRSSPAEGWRRCSR